MRGAALVLASLLVVGAAAWLVVRWRRDASASRLEAEVMLDLERSGVGDLTRAQLVARQLVARQPGPGPGSALGAITALAFADATLAVELGLDARGETERLLARLPVDPEAAGGRDSRWSMEAAARALALVQRGKRAEAIVLAARAAAAAPGNPYPLYALGRARARAGDLTGAAQALEAAIVAGPGFGPARNVWAEVELDLGDAKAARAAVEAVLAQAPGDLQARTLLDEANIAVDAAAGLPPFCTEARSGTGEGGAAGSPVPQGDGRTPPPLPPTLLPFLRASCSLGDAVRARRAGDRARAIASATDAARMAPDAPRLLLHIAESLAQLGSVDLAAGLLERARPLIDADAPAFAWAATAIALGRGRAPTLPEDPRPADPETRLLVARAALAAGGLGELGQALDRLGPGAVAHDADLRLFARLRLPVERGADREGDDETDDPVRAYVDGLRAQLQGDLPAAVERFWHALAGHGDACRAVGEYVATLRTLELPADPSAWRALPTQNAGCKNLH